MRPYGFWTVWLGALWLGPVVPAHSFKFISELQAKHTGDLPVMIRIDVDAGHGAGKPLSKRIDESADIWAFVFYHLGISY